LTEKLEPILLVSFSDQPTCTHLYKSSASKEIALTLTSPNLTLKSLSLRIKQAHKIKLESYTCYEGLVDYRKFKKYPSNFAETLIRDKACLQGVF
jgi:hypothetical protein